MLGQILRGNDGKNWMVYRVVPGWIYVAPKGERFTLDDTRKVRTECVRGSYLHLPDQR